MQNDETSAFLEVRRLLKRIFDCEANQLALNSMQHFKRPDLRASHIRRLADLRSRGADAEAMAGVTRASFVSLERDHHDTRASSSKSDNERKDHISDTSQSDNHRLVAATFSSYRPETDAEVLRVVVPWHANDHVV